MSLFASKWLAHAVLVSALKHVESQLPRVRNVWRDQSEPELKRALAAAWNRLDDGRLALQDAITLIKEASK